MSEYNDDDQNVTLFDEKTLAEQEMIIEQFWQNLDYNDKLNYLLDTPELRQFVRILFESSSQQDDAVSCLEDNLLDAMRNDARDEHDASILVANLECRMFDDYSDRVYDFNNSRLNQ